MKKIRFRGLFKHSVDHKGRVAIPHPFRKILLSSKNGVLVLVKGYDGEIEVHPLKEWERFEEDILLALPYYKKSNRRFRRRRTFSATEVAIDSQGRIMLPKHLIEYARVETEVIITGNITYFEIWSPEVYERFLKESEAHQEEDSETLDRFLNRGKSDIPLPSDEE